MPPTLINNAADLGLLLDRIAAYEGHHPPAIYVDLEGNNLSRDGTLSLVTIFIDAEDTVYLVDVTTLKDTAFTSESPGGHTLKGILESDRIIKVFFDIRNDSDALYALHEVRVSGIHDLQLMELASRDFSKRCINGLAKCIERDSGLSFSEKTTWRQAKDVGRDLFAPERGGRYAIFDERPLSPEMLQYCAQDVIHMPLLYRLYRQKLSDVWWARVQAATRDRIVLSQSATFNGHGPHMAMGPSGWV